MLSLALAAIADHAEACHLEVAMLGGILVHAMLFHFILGLLFGLMHVGMAHFAGHGYSVTPVRRKPDGLAVELPGAAIFGGQLVLVSALSLSQTASQRPDFGVLVLAAGTNRWHQQQRGYGEHTQQQFILHEFSPFLNLRSEKSLPFFHGLTSSTLGPNHKGMPDTDAKFTRAALRFHE